MGNCFPIQKTNTNSSGKHEKVLKVIKTDGKIFEYKRAMLVQDILLMNFFAGYYGIVLSDEPSKILPQNYKLKTGNVCHLVPLPGSNKSMTAAASASDGGSQSSGTTKRIKVIMTKKEFEELLSNKISMEEMLLLGNYSSKWQPVLETITEES